MACKEENAKVFDIRRVFEHFTERLQKQAVILLGDAVTFEILVDDEFIWIQVSIRIRTNEFCSFDCNLEIIFDLWQVNLCLNSFCFAKLVDLAVLVLHYDYGDFFLGNKSLGSVLLSVSWNLHNF